MNLWRNCLPLRKKKPSTTMEPAADTLTELLSNDVCPEAKEFQVFSLFPRLPAELRIKIWECAFVPRIVTLKRHSHRPCDKRSIEALLLVNQEARYLFLRKYARYFGSHGLRGIYLNFDLDTLSLSGKHAKKDLVKLLKQYSRTMSKVKYLDIYPEIWRTEFSWDRCSIQKTMTALELLIVRLPPPIKDSDTRSPLLSQMNLAWNLSSISSTMGKSEAREVSDKTAGKARLAAIYSPTSSLPVIEFEATFSHVGGGLRLMRPSESTWDRIEATMPDDLSPIWPGRENYRDRGWFINEILIL